MSTDIDIERLRILAWATAEHDKVESHWCDRKYLMSCHLLVECILRYPADGAPDDSPRPATPAPASDATSPRLAPVPRKPPPAP